MSTIPFWQVNAFTSRSFHGNPAAVCVLEAWLDDDVLQQIAAENNLSETAFLVAREPGQYDLRWMTPVTEVDLCGHATLASAFVVFHALETDATEVRFETRSGTLTVNRDGDRLAMDFPARSGTKSTISKAFTVALGKEPVELYEAEFNYLAVYATPEDVWELEPDFAAVAALPFSVIATAPGAEEHDFVSRYFAPAVGVPEDPVTGSAHCMLAPYWAKRLDKNPLEARQISARGGDITCEVRGDRVHLVGDAVLFASGEIHLGSTS